MALRVDTDLSRLLEGSRRGDERSWSAIVEQFQSLVYSICVRGGLEPNDAADVFQATFIALYEHLDRIESPAALPRWVAVTASREASRVRRIAARNLAVSLDDDRSLDEVLAVQESAAHEEAERSLQADALRKAMAALSEKCRTLLSLLFGYSEAAYGEISEKTGMAVGAIGPTRARCLDRLRKILEARGFFDE